MCGRFTLVHNAETLARIFAVQMWKFDFQPSFNIAPSQQSVVVLGGRDNSVFRTMQWGLIPSWAKDARISSRLINARAETAFEKPTFRMPFKKRRCIVPASGFFEWKKTPGGRTPYYITSARADVLAFAGLWDRWEPDRNTVVDTFTILTTTAAEGIAPIHDRMPVILDQKGRQAWMNTPVKEAETLIPLLVPCENTLLTAFPVSPRVNNPANNDASLIEEVRIGESGETPSLF